jgi:hypothetical protein
MAFIVALTVMLILFVFHLHGREAVDIHLHMLLVYSIAACILSVSLEMYFQTHIQAAIARYLRDVRVVPHPPQSRVVDLVLFMLTPQDVCLRKTK